MIRQIRKHRLHRLTLFVFISFFLFSGKAQALTFTINPSRLELTIPAGSTKAITVYADNTKSDVPLHVRVFLQDIAHLPDGTNNYLPLNSTPWSFADWITVKPIEFELPAGGYQGVRLSVSVPAEVKGGRYGVIFFEAAPPLGQKKGISAILRLGTVVSVDVDKTAVYKARLTKISTSKSEEGLEIIVKLYNGGNVLFRPSGEVKIKDDKEREIARMELNPARGGVLPGASRIFKVKCGEPIQEGRYSIEAVVDYGGDVLIGGKKEVSFLKKIR